MWSQTHTLASLSRGDELAAPAQFLELSEEDCRLLTNAGLKLEKGRDPRDVYCLQVLPSFYDGTPLQVLRLLEEARRQGGSHSIGSTSSAKFRLRWGPRDSSEVVETLSVAKRLEDDAESSDASEDGLAPLIQVNVIRTPSSSTKSNTRAASPAPRSSTTGTPGHAVHVITPQTTPSHRAVTRASMRAAAANMTIDTSPLQDANDENQDPRRSSSARKRKSESPAFVATRSRSSSRTPSPGSTKARRTSVLRKFETPDQQATPATPQTVPAPPTRLAYADDHQSGPTEDEREMLHTDVQTELLFDDVAESSEEDELEDDGDEEGQACCEVPTALEPIWDALQRTSSRFHSAWQEAMKMTTTKRLKTTSAP
ncbi:hypothetical protein PINS_up002214 [Pythium insidiosum]|nr:hypothetical protein PINS_up002214 [Pythium insidiosum]